MKQRDRRFLMGLLASAAAPFLGKVAKPILKNIFGGSRRRYRKFCKILYLDEELFH